MSQDELRPILDHGYVKLIEFWGSDERIIEAARMSTSGGFVSWEPYDKHPNGDLGLLRYMWKNKHTTPFEMAGATFEVQAPISVFRQWHRHRTQSYSEFSARYSSLPDMFYIPTIERLVNSSKKDANKQATGSMEIGHAQAKIFQQMIENQYEGCRQLYEEMMKQGLSSELARIVVPVGQYSKMRASANLWNWLRFLKLRMDEHAQWEIRQYAIAVKEILLEHFSRTMKFFMEELNGKG